MTQLDELKVEAVRYGVERDVNPFIALLEEIRRSAGHVAWLSEKIREAPTDDSLLEDWAPWMRLYHKEREHLVKSSETAIRLGLEERVVRVEEQKAELVARVMLATLAELGLPPEVMARAPAILREQLLALEAGG